MSKPKQLTMDDGSVYAVVDPDYVLALEERVAELESAPDGTLVVPQPQVVTAPLPPINRAGYYRLPCLTNAKNRFTFLHGGGRGRSLAARGYSRFALYSDPDGSGPDRPGLMLSYIHLESGEVFEPVAYGQIELPEDAPAGEYALEVDAAYSEAEDEVVVTLYPHG